MINPCPLLGGINLPQAGSWSNSSSSWSWFLSPKYCNKLCLGKISQLTRNIIYGADQIENLPTKRLRCPTTNLFLKCFHFNLINYNLTLNMHNTLITANN